MTAQESAELGLEPTGVPVTIIDERAWIRPAHDRAHSGSRGWVVLVPPARRLLRAWRHVEARTTHTPPWPPSGRKGSVDNDREDSTRRRPPMSAPTIEDESITRGILLGISGGLTKHAWMMRLPRR